MTGTSPFDPAPSRTRTRTGTGTGTGTRTRTRPAAATVPVGRRTLLRGAAASVLGLGCAAGPAGCGVPGHRIPAGRPTGEAGHDDSATEARVVFANWASYIDTDPKHPAVHPTLAAFTRQTGINVDYLEIINDNNDWYTKIDPLLVRGADTGYDLMVVSDYMVSKYRSYDYLQELDLANIPHHANLLPEVMADPSDPGRRFTIPWAYGYTTVAYNKDLVKQPVTAIAELFTRPDLHGKVALFVEMEDTIGLAMLALGIDPERFTDAQFDQALEYVRRAKDSGQIRGFQSSEYLGDFQQGNTAATMAYSGDIAQLGIPRLVALNQPREGMLSWSDNLVIPNFARHKTNAEKLLDYYLQPAVAAQVDDYTGYPPVVRGGDQALTALDPTTAGNPFLVPTSAMRKAARGFKALTNAQLDHYTGRFQQISGQ